MFGKQYLQEKMPAYECFAHDIDLGKNLRSRNRKTPDGNEDYLYAHCDIHRVPRDSWVGLDGKCRSLTGRGNR